ncbi:hypothetical protein HK104_009671 [Borealophlyctis nickersoniae]|nr:hypothetical protein HK104_009671 [Borealophlyctis nickersoniae]
MPSIEDDEVGGRRDGPKTTTQHNDTAHHPPSLTPKTNKVAPSSGSGPGGGTKSKTPGQAHPKFDKEKFKKANKEPMKFDDVIGGQGRSPVHKHPRPALSTSSSTSSLSSLGQAIGSASSAFLDPDDEAFMAEILKETQFVVDEGRV